MFCFSQIHNRCLLSTCSYPAWYRAAKVSNVRLTSVNAADKLLLVRLGAVACKANGAKLATAAGICKALSACNVDPIVLKALNTARRQPNALCVLPLPGHMLQPCAQPSPNPPGLQLLSELPVTLPACLSCPEPRERYGLAVSRHHLWQLNPLQQQLKELQQYTMSDIQLDRAGQAHCTRTWENTEAHASLFLGFCYHYHSVQQPTLQHFLSPALMAHYISFRKAAQHSSLTIKSTLSTAAVIVRWWQTKPGGHDPSLVKFLEWLSRLSQQVQCVMHTAVAACLDSHTAAAAGAAAQPKLSCMCVACHVIAWQHTHTYI